MDEREYELWRELWRVVERRDGAIYKTEKIGEGWFPEADIKANKSSETDLMYVAGGKNAPLVSIRTAQQASKEQGS